MRRSSRFHEEEGDGDSRANNDRYEVGFLSALQRLNEKGPWPGAERNGGKNHVLDA